jgi:hypothetical protein
MTTRYIGDAFLPAALVIVFVGGGNQIFGRRCRDTLILLGLACAPLLINLARNTTMTGTATNRSFVYHPLSAFDYLSLISYKVQSFIAPIPGTIPFPDAVKLAIYGLLVACLMALFLYLFRRYLAENNWRSMGFIIPVSCLLFSAFYLLFLFASINYFDATVPVDERILSPVFLLLVLGVFSAPWAILNKLKISVIGWSLLFFLVLIITLKISDAAIQFSDIRENGLGWTSKQWQDLESLAFVRSLPEDRKIYSPIPEVLAFLTEKRISDIPVKYNRFTTVVNPLYNKEIDSMCKDVRENGAFIIYFNAFKMRDFPTQEEIITSCQISVLQSFTEVTVYGEIY